MRQTLRVYHPGALKEGLDMKEHRFVIVVVALCLAAGLHLSSQDKPDEAAVQKVVDALRR